MAKVSWPGSVLMSPVPATLVTCGTMEQSNVLTVAWTGIACTKPPMVYVSIRPERHSYSMIKNTNELVINLPTATMCKIVDKCGVYTGAKVDKFKQNHLTKTPAEKVACPLIEECPVSLECKVHSVLPLGSHDMFLCEVVAVDVEETLLDEKGALHMEKANLLAYAHGNYHALGRLLGKFGWAVKKNGSKKEPIPKKRISKS